MLKFSQCLGKKYTLTTPLEGKGKEEKEGRKIPHLGLEPALYIAQVTACTELLPRGGSEVACTIILLISGAFEDYIIMCLREYKHMFWCFTFQSKGHRHK